LFNTPIWIVSDSTDNLYVAEFRELVHSEDYSRGVVHDLCGQGARGAGWPLATATFDSPNGLAFGPDGSLFVSDWNNGKIRQIKNGAVTTFAIGARL